MGVAGSTGVADMWLRASDRPKAEARLSELEQRVLRLWEAVTEGNDVHGIGSGRQGYRPDRVRSRREALWRSNVTIGE
jgi:hypothetical protein